MRIFGLNISKRNASANKPTSPLDDRWYQPFLFTQPTNGGVMVNPETAITNPTVYACVKVISETLASMPLITYKRDRKDPRSKDRASDHPVYFLLKNQPNSRMTAFEFKEMLTGHYLLRGNAYAQIIHAADGSINSLWPLHPGRMEVLPDYREGAADGAIVYKYHLQAGETILFEWNQIFHLRGPSDGGLTGRTPIDCFRDAIGLGLSMDAYISNFYSNSASPSGILTMPAGTTLSTKAKDRLREDWQKKYSGAYRAGNVAVLEDGVTWQAVGMSATDAQYIETEKMTDLKIARCFRMPPHKIGIMDKATYNNIEHQGIEYYTDTMLPHLKRFEQALERDILNVGKSDKYFIEFTVDSILRGDILTRYKAYSIARQWGWKSVNDIRAHENENPIEEGDTYLQPLNMIDASEATDYLMKDDAATQPGVKMEGEDPSDPTLNSKFSRLEEFVLRNMDIRNHQVLRGLQGLENVLEKRFSNIERVQKEQESRENQAKIAENEVKTSKKEDDILGPSFGAVRSSSVDMFAETISRFVRKEISARQNAQKKGKEDSFSEDFFPKQKEQLVEALRSQIRSYVEQVRFFAKGSERQVLSESKVPESVEAVSLLLVNEYVMKFTGSDDPDSTSRSMANYLVLTIEEYAAPGPSEARNFVPRVIEVPMPKRNEPEVVREEPKKTIKRRKFTKTKDEQGNVVFYLDEQEIPEEKEAVAK